MSLSEDSTLGESKAWLRARVNDGEHCPCCTQFVKVYRRKMTSGKTLALIAFYREGGTDWFDIHKIDLRHGEYGQLRWWGLIEPETPEAPEDKRKRTGWWRVTEAGANFVLGRTTIHACIRTYDNKFLGFAGEQIDIRQALGSKFDYDELMSTSGAPDPMENP